MGGDYRIQKVPIYLMEHGLHTKKYGGLGLKNLAAWNKASIAKLVWCVALKKDMLWVKWVHGKYLK